MRVDELDYVLPDALIAKYPPVEREAARLLILARDTGALTHGTVLDLPQLFSSALFVFNDTRVLPARLVGQKPSGGRFELLLVERLSAPGARERWLCMGKPLKNLRPGLALRLGPLQIEVGARESEQLIEVELTVAEGLVEAALQAVGQLPLPPYLARAPEGLDSARYQTVFARELGAVAAPTAGLHFGERMLEALQVHGHERAFVTLHVGPGTFAPLNVDDLAAHPMHAESYAISTETVAAIARAKQAGRPVIAVGTTVVRTLESCAARHGGVLQAETARTQLCIYPPYKFHVVDALVTNFHLPRSTLLALVMAFGATEHVRAAYQAAIAAQYRFFSYGDAMLIADSDRLRTNAR
jgi:S-adenosylmethionine:tRNA ribosyltransferase-isomerase